MPGNRLTNEERRKHCDVSESNKEVRLRLLSDNEDRHHEPEKDEGKPHEPAAVIRDRLPGNE